MERLYEMEKNQIETQLQGCRNMVAYYHAQNEKLKEDMRQLRLLSDVS